MPIVCHGAEFGTGVRDRAIDGAAERFDAPPPRLYAWFAVALPAVYRQGINFQWFCNGRAAGRPVPSSVVGGRKEGYRTWSYLTAPPAGEWRVDVLTDAGQLICRESTTIGGRALSLTRRKTAPARATDIGEDCACPPAPVV